MKYSFRNDYSEGAHPYVLEMLSATNNTQENGYGDDQYSKQAAEKIRFLCKNEKAKVYFVSGGTQTNFLVISALLKPYESVISAETGHINTNETGAVEHAGFKIHALHSEDGKLTPEMIFPVLENNRNFPHQTKPRLVYISNSTELGTVYTKDELQKLSDFCRENGLLIFMDGARLGNAVVSEKSDLDLESISLLTDVFYIGGTKNGALFGEAVVVNRPELLADFPFYLKQNGALLAKGRVLGSQFLALFEDGLYFELAEKANRNAEKIRRAFDKKNISFLSDSPTNQLFPVLKNEAIEKLLEYFEFYIWKKINEEFSAIRLITSWKTDEKSIDLFIEKIDKFL